MRIWTFAGRRSRAAALAFAALCAGLFIDAAARHTDDGCAVETHCVVCLHAIGSVAAAAPAPVALPRPVLHVANVAAPAVHADSAAVVLHTPSRAPPLA